MREEKKGNVVRRAFRIAAQGKGTLFLGCAFSTIGMLSGIVPYLSVYFIARQFLMSAPSGDTYSIVVFWIIAAGASIVFNMVFTFSGSYVCHRVAFRLLYHFRLRVMEHIGKLSMGFFSDHTTGSIQKTMDENIEKIEGFVAHMLPDIIGSAAVVAVLFVSLMSLNIWLALVSILTILLAMGMQLAVFGGKKAKQLWVDISTADKEMTGAFSEYIKGMAEVKLFGQTGAMTGRLVENIDRYSTWELKQYRRSALPMSAYKTIVLSMLAFVLPTGILLILVSPTTSTLLAVLMSLIIVPAIYDPLMVCVNYGTQMGMLAVGLDAIDEILERKPYSLSGESEEPNGWDVEFHDVSFSYQDASDPLRKMALSHISFRAEQGKITALVGPSGGGKSTIGQLLSRFWDVESGRITIGGADIRRIRHERLMDLIATVFQDTYLFSDTILGNITMNRNYSEEQVVQAAQAAQCHEFIMNLPGGYETRIGTGGIRLSGGEAQRISIARAILKNSPIIILDEALAYSDAENENLIQKAIHNLLKDKTVIIIAHRLRSIEGADRILVLRDGLIIENGTHESLTAGNTEYRALWELQHEADAWAIDISHREEAEI